MDIITEPIVHEVEVPLGPEAAFARFVDDFAEWWPPEYTWADDALERIAIEPKLGGFCFELGPMGFRCDWGRVLEWEPPSRLMFTWQIGPRREPVPDDRLAGTVAVSFRPAADASTRLELEHGGFDRYGEGAAEYREAMDSQRGWPHILERFAAVD